MNTQGERAPKARGTRSKTETAADPKNISKVLMSASERENLFKQNRKRQLPNE